MKCSNWKDFFFLQWMYSATYESVEQILVNFYQTGFKFKFVQNRSDYKIKFRIELTTNKQTKYEWGKNGVLFQQNQMW